MKIFLLNISKSPGSQDLGQVLKKIAKDSIVDRNRVVQNHNVKVDRFTYDKNENLFFLNFTKDRHDAPSKTKVDSKSEAITLRQDETFCEETAVLYCPKKNLLVCQYNHYGVRFGAIEEYFSIYKRKKNNSYLLDFVLDPAIDNKIKNLTGTKKYKVKLNVRNYKQITPSSGSSLLNGLDYDGAETMTIEFSQDRKKSSFFSNGQKNNNLNWLRKLLKKSNDVVETFEVTGVKSGVDAKAVTYNIIEQRVFKDFQVNKYLNSRLSFADRKISLKSAYDEWISTGVI